MAFWSSQTLQQKLPDLINPYCSEKIEQSSYTLAIGKEIFITKDYQNDNSQHTKRSLRNKQAFVIPPGQFAFLLTEERIAVPKDAIAFISMKASFKYKGLINISGFHVDPGFYGNLLFSVYNAGPSPIHLRHNEPCFLIWYADIDQEDSKPREKQGFSEIPMEVLNKITTDEVYSIQALTSKIADVEKKYNSVIWWTTPLKFVGGLFLTAIISGATIFITNFDTISKYYIAISQVIKNQEEQLQSSMNATKSENTANKKP